MGREKWLDFGRPEVCLFFANKLLGQRDVGTWPFGCRNFENRLVNRGWSEKLDFSLKVCDSGAPGSLEKEELYSETF